jgi:hypothetical protein
MTKEQVFVRQHKDDPEIIEIYSLRKTLQGTQLILYASVHLDLLFNLGFNWATDDYSDFQLALVSK